MGMKHHTREDDMRLLWMLDAHETCGQPLAEIARAEGVTRNTVAGLIYRVRREADAMACLCRRPENRDGGMPRRWWSGMSGSAGAWRPVAEVAAGLVEGVRR